MGISERLRSHRVRLNSRVDGEFRRFRESLLHERQDLGPEFLHARKDFVGC
jgi:hypothetical protein